MGFIPAFALDRVVDHKFVKWTSI